MAHNFTLIREENINEISAAAFIYRHQTGAELIHIKNGDNNKVFCAAFKTPPENNTGVFHVLEHCVLCGSRKYPLKDPFSELSKGSLHTYLNAMTFKDKTLYPVAGTNEKDFFKMTDVYLDAVFFPLVKEKKEIMLQEGVNLKLDTEGNVTGNGGIVFNEMTGSFAEPDEYLKAKAYEKLFANSAYMYDSGGLPEEIPQLTYEYLLSCHEKNYHPANAYLYLYGDLDIEKYLTHIDNEYLSHFTADCRRIETPCIKLPEHPIEFEITGKADKANPQQVEKVQQGIYSKILPRAGGISSPSSYGLTAISADMENTTKIITGLSLLSRYLFRSEASPVKRLVSDEKLGDKIADFLDFHLPKPALSITVKNCASISKVNERIISVVSNLANNGFDEELLDSSFQVMEFQIKEENYGIRPKGLHYMIIMSSRWLYGGDPFEPLMRKKIFSEIKNDREYLMELALKFFVNNNAVVSGQISDGYTQKLFIEKKADPQDILDNEALTNYQKLAEDEKTLSLIPTLALSDIEKKAEIIPFEFEPRLKSSRSQLDTNGITYMNFMFDIDKTNGLIKNLSLLSYFLGKLDTKNFKFYELNKQMAAYLGGINFSHHCFSSVNERSFSPKFMISVKALDENIDKAFKYTREIILDTSFTDEQRIKTLILEYKAQLYSRIISGGHSWALSYASAPLHPADMHDEITSGITFYKYLASLDDLAPLCEELKQLSLSIFNERNFSFHYTSKNNAAEKYVADFSKSLPQYPPINHPITNGEPAANIRIADEIKGNARFVTGTPVYFSGYAFDYNANGCDYDGSMNVLSNVLNNQYLLQKIRLEGGAYGFGGSFNKRGLACFYSYRDPNLEKTFDVFKSMSIFIENLELSERQMTQYIIGALNSSDSPKRPNVNGMLALTRYLCGITDDYIQNERIEILQTTSKKLKIFNRMLDISNNEPSICTFGGGEERNPVFTDEYKIIH